MTHFNVKIAVVLIFIILLGVAVYHRVGAIESEDGVIQSPFIELSASIPGRLHFFEPLRPGNEIQKGEPLYWIENRQFANQESIAQHYSLNNLLNTLTADIASLGVELIYAEKNVKRARQLYSSKTLSAEELEGRETECERITNLMAAKKRHSKQIKRSLNEIAVQLQKFKREDGHSPVNGVVWAVFAQAGEHHKNAAPLLALVDRTELFVDAYWSEKHLCQLELGRAVEIEVIASGEKFVGVISSVRAGVGRVHFANPEQQPAKSYKKRVIVTRIRISENKIPFGAHEFYGVGVSVRARLRNSPGESK